MEQPLGMDGMHAHVPLFVNSASVRQVLDTAKAAADLLQLPVSAPAVRAALCNRCRRCCCTGVDCAALASPCLELNCMHV